SRVRVVSNAAAVPPTSVTVNVRSPSSTSTYAEDCENARLLAIDSSSAVTLTAGAAPEAWTTRTSAVPSIGAIGSSSSSSHPTRRAALIASAAPSRHFIMFTLLPARGTYLCMPAGDTKSIAEAERHAFRCLGYWQNAYRQETRATK